MDGSLFEILLKADLYGTIPTFNLGRSRKSRALFSSILSILSTFANIVGIAYFAIELFDSTQPHILFSRKNIFNPPNYELSANNNGFAFGLQN